LWREFVVQFLLRIPAGGRRLNLNNLSFVFIALKARLTFTTLDGDGADEKTVYGQLDDRKYTQDKYEAVQIWLMDPDACPTTWPELLRIRAENPNYAPARFNMHDPVAA
jgi:hypothetical protein